MSRHPVATRTRERIGIERGKSHQRVAIACTRSRQQSGNERADPERDRNAMQKHRRARQQRGAAVPACPLSEQRKSNAQQTNQRQRARESYGCRQCEQAGNERALRP